MAGGRPKKVKENVLTSEVLAEGVNLLKSPYAEGQIIADVKIVKIDPENPRPINFVMAKRDREGRMILDADKRWVMMPGTGNIMRDHKGEIVWDSNIRYMTIHDFELYIKKRPHYTSLV